MTEYDILRVLRNRRNLAEAFDEAGLSFEADEQRRAIVTAMMSDDFKEAVGSRRYAIRGYSSWDEYLENIVSDVGGGAAFGAVIGGVPSGGIGAPLGAGIGAAGGLLTGALYNPVSDAWYRGVRGNLSKSLVQAEDFANLANKMSEMISGMGFPQHGAAIQQVAQALNQDVKNRYQAKRQEVSSQYGLNDADKSWWQKIVPWMQTFRKMHTSESDGDMMRVAIETGSEVAALPTAFADEPIIGTLSAGAGGVGLGTIGLGVGAGAAGWFGANALYNKTLNVLRGKMGQLKNMAFNLGRMAQEISRQMQDPRYVQYAQRINQILGTLNAQLTQQMQRGVNLQHQK